MKICRDYRIPKASRTKKVGMRLPNISVRRIHMLNKIDPSGMTRKEYLSRLEQPYYPTDIPLEWLYRPPS
jgi:hypothetical protein